MDQRRTSARLKTALAVASAIAFWMLWQGTALAAGGSQSLTESAGDTTSSVTQSPTPDVKSVTDKVQDTADDVSDTADKVTQTAKTTTGQVTSTAGSAVSGATQTAGSAASSLTGTQTTTRNDPPPPATSAPSSSAPQSAPQTASQSSSTVDTEGTTGGSAGASTNKIQTAKSTKPSRDERLRTGQRADDSSKVASSGNLIGAPRALSNRVAGDEEKANAAPGKLAKPNAGSAGGGLPFTGMDILVWLMYGAMLVGAGVLLLGGIRLRMSPKVARAFKRVTGNTVGVPQAG